MTEVQFSKYDAGGDFLRSSDLLINGEFKTVVLKISEYHPVGSLKAADGKSINNPVLSFEGKQKKLVVGKTSQEMLHYVTGQGEGEKTVGHSVMVQVRVVDAWGEKCYGLRIVPFPGMLIRKGLRKYLGLPAVWESSKPVQMKEESEQK